jgi:hypothetical protein
MRIQTLACGLIALSLAAGTRPVAAAAEDSKAAQVLAAARKAIGDKKLESLKTVSVEASLQRNVNAMQLTSEVEILIELPDKYLRSDVASGPMSGGFSIGFNGDKPIRPANSGSFAGGGMVIRMGPGGPPPSNEKLSPEQQEKMDKQMLRMARADISRLMLGWFAAAHPALDAQYTYAGEAESPDGKAHVIDAKNAEGFAARLFIDQATNLPLMVTYQAPAARIVTTGGPRPPGAAAGVPQGGQREMTDEERKRGREIADKQIQDLQGEPPALVDFTVFFDEWREVGGVKFPHKMRRASGGTTSEEWTINKVKVNPKFDQKKFEG